MQSRYTTCLVCKYTHNILGSSINYTIRKKPTNLEASKSFSAFSLNFKQWRRFTHICWISSLLSTQNSILAASLPSQISDETINSKTSFASNCFLRVDRLSSGEYKSRVASSPGSTSSSQEQLNQLTFTN